MSDPSYDRYLRGHSDGVADRQAKIVLIIKRLDVGESPEAHHVRNLILKAIGDK